MSSSQEYSSDSEEEEEGLINFIELVKQKSICLSNKNLNGDKLDVLVKVIKQSTILEELDLQYNNIGEKQSDFKLFANAIAKNRTLKVLSLFGNSMCYRRAEYLADALKKNRTLQELRLDGENNWNSITLDEIKHLASALTKKNNTLQELSIGGYDIGNKGAKYIADMLAVNKSLKCISLNRNNISNDGAQSIATCLTKNTSLHTIHLIYNRIGNEGADKLADALESNHSIETLDLSYNKISRDVMDRIRATGKDPKSGVGILKQYIAKKDKELEGKDAEIAKKDTVIAKKDDEITDLKDDLSSKEKEIVSLKGALESCRPVTVDLASEEDDEPSSKRTRTSTSDTSMEIWDKDTPRMMTRHQNQMNRASEKPIVKLENKVMGFKRCPYPQCNTIGLFTKGCSIVTCRMNMRHNGKFHHFCFYCGKSAVDSADSCNNGVCPYKIDEESRKDYQKKLDEAFAEFSRQTRQAGGAYDADKV